MALAAPIIAHENVRAIPALSQKVFRDAASGANQDYFWEFDLAAFITDPGQLLNTAVAPANSQTVNGGGAGPQIAPQAAIGPICDIGVFTSGAAGGTISASYAVDANPCLYRTFFTTPVPTIAFSNVSGLRVTGRFLLLGFRNITAGAVVELGFYIRST